MPYLTTVQKAWTLTIRSCAAMLNNFVACGTVNLLHYSCVYINYDSYLFIVIIYIFTGSRSDEIFSMYLILLAALGLGFTQPVIEMSTRNIKNNVFREQSAAGT
jgi:hypothetical protein